MSDNPFQNISVEEPEESSILDSFDLEKFLFVLRKSIFAIILIALLCGVGVFLFLRYTKPVYEANTTLKLEFQSSSQLLNLDIGFFNEGIDAINLAGEIALIRSKLIFHDVIDSADLRISYFLDGDFLSEEKYQSSPFVVDFKLKDQSFVNKKMFVRVNDPYTFELIYEKDKIEYSRNCRFGEYIENDFFALTVTSRRSRFPEVKYGQYFFVYNSDEVLYSYLSKFLIVDVENKVANTIAISFSDFNKNKATEVLKAVNQSYLVKTIENKNRVYEQSLSFLERQFVLVKDTLDFYEKEIEKFKDVQKLPIKDDVYNLFSKIEVAQTEKTRIEFELESYTEIEKLIQADSSISYISMVAGLLNDSQLSGILTTMQTLQADAERIINYYKETTTARKKIDRELAAQIWEINKLIDFKKELLRKQIQKINLQLNEYEASMLEDTDETSEFKKINRYYSFYDKVANDIIGKRLQIEIAKAGTVPDFRVLSPPNAKSEPIYPVALLIYAVGAIAALFFSVTFVFVRYLTNNKINNLKELQKHIKAPILGMVPKVQEEFAYSQLLVDKRPKSNISESIRAIRTNLEFIASEHKQKTISVTSTISGEGKTFVAVNLGGIIAMADTKVLVIDLDLRKPKVHLAFNGSNGRGVSTILIGRHEASECIVKSDIPTLHYLSAGPIPPNPSELIMSEAFDKLLEKLKLEYDTIILDSPPVGLVTDGVIVMKKADIPIYVFRAGYSKVAFTASVNNLFEINKLNNISVILNAADVKNSYGYSYYSPAYGYGYNYSQYSEGGSQGYYDETEKTIPWWKKIINR
ncbi:polysaccharide biosynthesis tyrosine autokinase [Flammeovirgaceae bacterium SG7u.111]|nr:polysaccharide biosynthesis tyrosine autokinase [Flammeovirgaceae bacterium SG7u.132]WPO36527.1 polysaccharide biosynthesis tyrosine autokinase [Flammeovirgaceae bacterium SG7u.111]